MATTNPDGLQALLAAVGVEDPTPSFPLADTQNNPLGIYLSYLAEALVKLTECEPQVAYDSIHWPNEQCDLAVVLPRLRLQDVKLEELATDIIQRVGVALSHLGSLKGPMISLSLTHTFWPTVPSRAPFRLPVRG